jgi:hypothetical protein
MLLSRIVGKFRGHKHDAKLVRRSVEVCVSREDMMGYGFLLAGFGAPYLMEHYFGPTAGFIVAVACCVVGACFLFFGHAYGRGFTKEQIAFAVLVILVVIGISGWRLRSFRIALP